MPKIRPTGIQRNIFNSGLDRCWIEVNGRAYACSYVDGYFGELTDDEILIIVRKHYRDNPKNFRPYNVSTGYFID